MKIVSRRFWEAAKLSRIPLYRHAIEAGVAPSTAYKWVRGIQAVDSSDPRFLALAERLCVPISEAVEKGGEK